MQGKVKKIKLRLVGKNALNLVGAFREQAQKEGWTEWEIREVLDEATTSDYTHLLAVLMRHCRRGGF